MMKENYPENFEDFIDRFSTEKDCINYISEIRWPSGFSCPHCIIKKHGLQIGVYIIVQIVAKTHISQQEQYFKGRKNH